MGQPLCEKKIVGVTGSTGLIGSALVTKLAAEGYEVAAFRRKNGEFVSNTHGLGNGNGLVPFEQLDAVVNLAGEPLVPGRWNSTKKANIRDSRVNSTRTLCDRLAALPHPPKVLVCASAIGYYGSRGDEILDETSLPGNGFLANVVQAWEAAAQPAVEHGMRVVFLRFGMVLSARGGALAEMLCPFRCGLGGRIGDGQQYWSWISLADAVEAILFALNNESLAGPVNVVSPEPMTNAAFVAALGKTLHRPTFATVPAWAARAAFGEMADGLLLASTRAVPNRLVENGFIFRQPRLTDALRAAL
jgi:uncharacterized protein (TIGR01777 family)